VAHGPQKKPLDFVGNPDWGTAGLGLRLRGYHNSEHRRMCVAWHMFNSNNFVT